VEELSSSVKVVSMIITAMYVCLAKKQGVDPNSIRVRVQTDGLKDFIATGNYVFPPKAALRVITDMIQYCVRNMPNWVPICLCGYHIREAGADAVQEVAFTLSNGIAYIEALLKRGLRIDDFAPRFNIFLTSHMDFFEEISKFRAVRRLWAKLLKERFGAKDPASCTIRLVCYTAGSPLTSQQPLNNVMRVTMEALAAVLGGVEVLFCSSFDETYCLPSEEAMRLAMMTQQIIAYETGVTNTVDPIGGSYFIEALTQQIEEKALQYILKVDEMGGSIKAIENGYFRKEIAKAAYGKQMEIERKKKIVIGVNDFRMKNETEEEIQLFRVDPEAEKRQVEKLRRLRKERDNDKVMRALERLKITAKKSDNLYPSVLDAVASYSTVGEICDALREVFGQYDENTYHL
jgi:methylmalonyl-CoA mutase N-terminal domain/subunit